MDYSLLVGIHFREASVAGELIPSGARTPIGSYFKKMSLSIRMCQSNYVSLSTVGEFEDDSAPRLSRVDVDQLLSDPTRYINTQQKLELVLGSEVQ